jgi:hypothetical protein
MGTLGHQNHGTGGENGSITVGMFVCLCLVSKKPSEQEFFVPTGTDLGVNSLTAIGAHESQLFIELLWWLVTSLIFVRC